MYPPVLDMCCGPRMMWFDKHDPRVIYIDKRRERHAMNRPKRGTVEWTETDPDQLSDFTDLPFPDETFDHVVFDPPHFERSGKMGYLAMKYGWLDGDWRKMLAAGFAEGFRVLRPGGTLIFKWTDTENPVSEILKLTSMRPLYGHKSGKQARTHWIAFLKQAEKVKAISAAHSNALNCKRRSSMSKKYDADEGIQTYVEKKVAAAVKAERKRVATAIKNVPAPTFGSKKESLSFLKTIKAAVAA